MFFYRTCLYILFDKVLEKKQAFLELKNVVLQKSKNLQFRKGLDILFNNVWGKKKQAFLDFEKVIFKKSENLYFRKGVGPRFWSKI